MDVRIVLDEDVPSILAEHLQARGYNCVSINDLKLSINPKPGASISDDEVCKEVSRVPSVLVTLNIRDYADFAFLKELAETYRVSVIIVRVPKKEAGAGKRPAAIHDIVHRHAHKIAGLYEGDPVIVSANRRGFRSHKLDDIHTEQTHVDEVPSA